MSIFFPRKSFNITFEELKIKTITSLRVLEKDKNDELKIQGLLVTISKLMTTNWELEITGTYLTKQLNQNHFEIFQKH